MAPKFLHGVLYEYLRVFLNTPFKYTLRNEKKTTFVVLKLSSQGKPQRTKNTKTNKQKKNQKWFQMIPKCDSEPF